MAAKLIKLRGTMIQFLILCDIFCSCYNIFPKGSCSWCGNIASCGVILVEPRLNTILVADSCHTEANTQVCFNCSVLYLQELEGRPSEEEESSSSEDEREWREELKRQRREAKTTDEKRVNSKPKFYELKSGENFRTVKSAQTTSALKQKK